MLAAPPLASSSTGKQELIVEVEQLRREMEERRARQRADEPSPLVSGFECGIIG